MFRRTNRNDCHVTHKANCRKLAFETCERRLLLVGVNIDDVTVFENDGQASFRVWLNGDFRPSHCDLQVDYGTTNGTAIGGFGNDFDHRGGRLTFAPFLADNHMDEYVVNVPIFEDQVYEGNEHFFLTLSNERTVSTDNALKCDPPILNDFTGKANVIDNDPDNAPPHADAGGPYIIEEGSFVELNQLR